MTVKAVADEQSNECQESNGTHNYNQPEADLLTALSHKQSSVHDSLCDSFNTSKAMVELKSLVSIANQYYAAKSKVKTDRPNAVILSKVGAYVTEMMRVFGVFHDSNAEIGAFPTTKAASVIACFNIRRMLMRCLMLEPFRCSEMLCVLLHSQMQVAYIIDEDPKEILKLCDQLRDSELPKLGIQVEDRDDGIALVKLVDADLLLQQRTERIALEAVKSSEKEERKRVMEERERAKFEQGKIPATEYFRTGEYSQWNESGVPTHDFSGVSIGKGKLKKLEREWQSQNERHEAYLLQINKD